MNTSDMETSKLKVGTTVSISTIIAILGVAVTWGTFSADLKQMRRDTDRLEARASKTEQESRAQEIALTKIEAQYQEIINRLRRMEYKLDTDNGEPGRNRR